MPKSWRGGLLLVFLNPLVGFGRRHDNIRRHKRCRFIIIAGLVDNRTKSHQRRRRQVQISRGVCFWRHAWLEIPLPWSVYFKVGQQAIQRNGHGQGSGNSCCNLWIWNFFRIPHDTIFRSRRHRRWSQQGVVASSHNGERDELDGDLGNGNKMKK